MKLLIAEDDLTSRTLLEAVTRKWGYEPVTAEDGEAAWELLQRPDAPRLLLLDWEMPKLGGTELCKRLRDRETTDPPFIILLTARSETNDIVEGLEAGANDYIAKPFENAELQARLRVGQRMLDLQAELNRTREELAYQASHDALTGVLDRGAMMEALEREHARAQRHSQTLCVAMCDIDRFKEVNDTHGHLVGDAVIREVVQCITRGLRPYDLVGRFGGEEFLVLLNAGAVDACQLFERIRECIAGTTFRCEESDIRVTVSFGLTLFTPPDDPRDPIQLLAAADRALYAAKEGGRNRTVVEP
ncbi:MAG: diguanylate cyclase [Gammaproteobacteria bacterium]